MIEKRVQYGIDNFLEEKFFLPSQSSYCLEEKSDSGRTELQVEIKGENLCSEDYDNKGKCNFLRRDSKFKLQRSVDHILIQKKEDKWILHLIEMKSKVNNKKWQEIKEKIRASYFNVCALEKVLGIQIDEIKTYTTYERSEFWDTKKGADPKVIVAPLGKPMMPEPKLEWENNRISVDIGEIVQLQHCAVKMQRTEDGSKLTGRLSID